MAKLHIVENSDDYKFPASAIAKSLGMAVSNIDEEKITNDE